MSEPRWLDAAQQRDWRSYIDGSVRLHELLDRMLKEQHDLSTPEFEILVRLSEVPERRMRMAELADSANQSRSRVTHTIARLESKGFVFRCECPSDRRGIYAELTDEGFATLERAARDHVMTVRACFIDPIDPIDLNAIGRAFRAVRQHVDMMR